jgi:hypothetical protein
MVDDKFGVKQIYATKPGGETWFLSDNPSSDSRFKPDGSVKGNANDGFYVGDNGQIRHGVYTTAGYNESAASTDHGKCASRGYMQDPKDWRNVEITGYIYHQNPSSGDEYVWYARGGRHTDPKPWCRGSAYKAALGFDGKTRFAKEQWHVSYVFTEWQDGIGSIKNKWVGLKMCLYNVGSNSVKMEIWVDKDNNNTWEKIDENLDDGGWGDEGEECDGDADQIITWGGPIATFRWDSVDDCKWKKFSVREIEPNSPSDGGGGGGPAPGPDPEPEPGPAPPNPPPATGLVSSTLTTHYRIATYVVPTCATENQGNPNPPPGIPPGGSVRQSKFIAAFYDLNTT